MVVLKFFYTLYARVLWFVLGFWAFLWAFIVSVLAGKRGRVAIITGYKIFAHVWCFLIGVRVKASGKIVTNSSPPGIIVSNHSSTLDMMTSPYVLPTKVAPMAKAEIKKIPMIGFMFKAVSVFVDRKDAESRKRSLEEMKEIIHQGVFLFMYPEGTRNLTGKPLKDFYDGAFKIAVSVQKPIIPLVFLNLWTVARPGSFLMWPGKITAVYLPEVSTTGLTESDVPALKEKVFNLMYGYIEQHDPYFVKLNEK